MGRELDEYVEVLRPSSASTNNVPGHRRPRHLQNIYTIEKANTSYVVILAGDTFTRWTTATMILQAHRPQGRRTIGLHHRDGATPRHGFGACKWTTDERVSGFQEKHKEPQTHAATRHSAWRRMGITVSRHG